MMRLKATKTSMYKLVSEYVMVPEKQSTYFWKAPKARDYYLEWRTENDERAQAALMSVLSRPFFQITVRDCTGKTVYRKAIKMLLEELKRRGMVEEVASAEERRRANV